ncbi:Calnexin [Neolecta irregularis DAH-3]|uniref:Calnexin n=1 Tax=Neolecta irregularis (strain DAH-3) TaxID=1198029 RepID=A0A1U7LWF3_NEOID|nr:Calnexin [Neolecta irregularis DAH-3]|eukprot:OLL26964.1 Calnexin [Neolecta irregularis DAH-3]
MHPYLFRSALFLLLCPLLVAADPAHPDADSPANTSADAAKPRFVPSRLKAAYLLEQFTPGWEFRWIVSKAKKAPEPGKEQEFSYIGKWAVEEPTVFKGFVGDKGLVVKDAAAHHAISAEFPQPIDNAGKTLVVQYEVKLQNGLECGGAYLKLLKEIPGEEFHDKTAWQIMFGPDRCGHNVVHFIFRHKNPLNGEYEEKHLESPPAARITKLSTLYTLIIDPDQSFEIKINNESIKKGSLLENFKPPVNPQKEIDDPEDLKPEAWVDEAKIPDPEAAKPDDWDETAPATILDEEAEKPEDWLEDEPLDISDPDAEKPEEWNDEEDGEWTPAKIHNPKCGSISGCGPWKRPMKANPNYKGKWEPPTIPNPNYKGSWTPRKIPNPNHYEDLSPANFERMTGLGFELWTMQSDILFDNIFIGDSIADAEKFAKETWEVKYAIEKAEEDASKKTADDLDSDEDWIAQIKSDPVGFIKREFGSFVEKLKANPVGTIRSMKYHVLTLLLAIFGSTFLAVSLFTPSQPQVTVVKPKKSEEPKIEKVDEIIDEQSSETNVTSQRSKSRRVD